MRKLISTFPPNINLDNKGDNYKLIYILGENEFKNNLNDVNHVNKLFYNDIELEIFKKKYEIFIPKNQGFKYRIDKFIYKIAAIREAIIKYKDQNDIVWLDSDVKIFQNPSNYFDEIRPGINQCFSYYDRINTYQYAETGIIYFSSKFSNANLNFFNYLYSHIISGEVFKSDEEWHDAFLIRKYALKFNLPVKNLCIDNSLITTNPIFEHKSARKCLIHMKGGRKNKSILLTFLYDYFMMIYYVFKNKIIKINKFL